MVNDWAIDTIKRQRGKIAYIEDLEKVLNVEVIMAAILELDERLKAVESKAPHALSD